MTMISLLLFSLIMWRGILVQKISVIWKIILAALLFLISFKFHIIRLFGGGMFSVPKLPQWMLLLMSWLFAWMVFYLAMIVFYEFAGGVSLLICKVKKSGKLKAFFAEPRWRAVCLLPAALLATIGMYEGLKIPEVREYEIVLKNLPAELDGFKILHLTDIHVDPFTDGDKVREIVRKSNMQDCDIIVITGDFVDGKVSVRGKDLQWISELHAPMGVYGVAGNHEYYSGYDSWMDFLAENNVDMLENEHRIIADGRLAVIGVADPAASRKNKREPNIHEAVVGIPDGVVKVLLAHQPKLASEAAKNGVDLQLSGHTHGGMVRGFDMMIAAFNDGFVSGKYDVGKMTLFISNGTGIWNGFPVRIGRSSEIAVITLKCE